MTTIVPFQPVAGQAFSFSLTLDGQQYTCVLTHNIFGQRWYANLYDVGNNLIVAKPVIGSPDPLALQAALETETVASMAWSNVDGGTVSVVMTSPSTFNLGDTIQVSGATNTGTGGVDAINGTFVINTFANSQHFTFLLSADVGVIGTTGGSPVLVLPTYALAWSNDSGVGLVTATTAARHNLPLGQRVNLAISGEVPAGYNGNYLCAVTGPSTFTYPLVADPGIETTPGTYSPNIDIFAGYFAASTTVFRESAQQFEVNP